MSKPSTSGASTGAPITDVDALFATLADAANFDDDEDVDLLAHALQCATLLAIDAPDDPELQIAGLVHDLGTVLEPGQPATHAATGAAAIAQLLGPRVAALVHGHDTAKRYLVATDAGYREQLSSVSVATLAEQGGPLSRSEIETFEREPEAATLLVLRRADDAAKVPGASTRPLSDWRPAVEALASPAATARGRPAAP
jgi:predicted HD phosphohydrolase